MKSCDDYQELISRMLDGDLSKSERAELAAHVKSCPDCAAVYVAFRSLSEHLGGELEEAPRSVHETVMAEVRRDQLRRNNTVHRSHRRWHTVLTIAACLVLVVAAGLSLPKLAPRMGKSAAAPQAAEDAVQAETPAEAPMLAAPETAKGALNSEKASQDSALSVEQPAPLPEAEEAVDEAPAEMSAEEPEAERKSITRGEDGELILDEQMSETFLALLTREQTVLTAAPTKELRLVCLINGEPRPLTLLLTEQEAVCVFADGDSYFRIDASPSELLELFGETE